MVPGGLQTAALPGKGTAGGAGGILFGPGNASDELLCASGALPTES